MLIKKEIGIKVIITGLPNSGKSSLFNSLLLKELSTVTHKRNTTSTCLSHFIDIGENRKIIFSDSPGFNSYYSNEKKDVSSKRLLNKISEGFSYANCVLFTVDSTNVSKKMVEILDLLKFVKSWSIPIILVLNKVDLLPKKYVLLEITKDLNNIYFFHRTFMVSAKKNNGVLDITKYVSSQVAVWGQPTENILTEEVNLCEVFSDITRGYILLQLHDELPYKIMIKTEKIDRKKDITTIEQLILCKNDRHKKIICGKQKSRLYYISRNLENKAKKFLRVNKLSVKVRVVCFENKNARKIYHEVL